MYRTLLFVSNKKYKKEKVVQILQKFCYDAEIPESFYGNFSDEHIKNIIAEAQPPEFLILIAKKKYKETRAEKYRKQLEEYDALIHNDIERFFNLQGHFSVKRGKIYTTKNLKDGKFQSVSFGIGDDFQKLLTKKNGNSVDVCKKEELADYVADSISLFFDYDNNKWHEIIRPLVIEDGEDFVYEEALKRAEQVRKSKQDMIELIRNVAPERYCYGLVCEL